MKESLKSIREKKNMTQKECADALGITLRAWQTYEQGVSEPKLDLLCRIADMFGVTTDYLLGRTERVNPLATLAAQSDLTPEAQEELYMSLPPEAQALVLELMRRMAGQKEARPVFLLRVHRNKTAAGFGYDLTSEDEWTEQSVLDGETVRRADFAVEVEGDSMEPDFHDGDLALIQLDPDVPLGKVGLFVVDGKGYIKERGKRCLISRNPDYPNIEGEARCIGLVIGTAERA